MDFSHALLLLKEGKRLTRSGWNGKGMWVELQFPDDGSKMTRPYIFINVPYGSSSQLEELKDAIGLDRIPWIPSQTDLMSYDWEEMA